MGQRIVLPKFQRFVSKVTRNTVKHRTILNPKCSKIRFKSVSSQKVCRGKMSDRKASPGILWQNKNQNYVNFRTVITRNSLVS